MAYVLYRDDKVIVALQEADDAPLLIVTQYSEEDETDYVIAQVRLPETGIEILTWSEGKRPETEPAPMIAEWGKRPSGSATGPHAAWRRPA
jgi:hypothetical protein